MRKTKITLLLFVVFFLFFEIIIYILSQPILVYTITDQTAQISNISIKTEEKTIIQITEPAIYYCKVMRNGNVYMYKGTRGNNPNYRGHFFIHYFEEYHTYKLTKDEFQELIEWADLAISNSSEGKRSIDDSKNLSEGTMISSILFRNHICQWPLHYPFDGNCVRLDCLFMQHLPLSHVISSYKPHFVNMDDPYITWEIHI